MPVLEGLISEIEKIEEYTEALGNAQRAFITKGKSLFNFMQAEKLESVGDVNLQRLRQDRASIDYAGILQLSDDIIDIEKRLNVLQFRLFEIGTSGNPLEFRLPEEKDPDTIPEFSTCGKYKRIKENGN